MHAEFMPEVVQYDIEHVSRYTYAAPVTRCAMLLCVEPRNDGEQRLLEFAISTKPAASLTRDIDTFGNARHVLCVNHPHEILEITSTSTVETLLAHDIPDTAGAGAWEAIHADRDAFADWDYTHPSALIPASAALDEFVRRHRISPGDDPLESLLQLSDLLFRRLSYVPGTTSAESTVEHILQSDRGVCQDYAHAMIAVARSWGIPSRYVSGYLHDSGDSIHQTADNASHAWVECRLPNLGWVGFDPTNARLATETHVRIATGRDYRDVSPTHGVIQGGGESRLEVNVRIRADHDDSGAPAPRREESADRLRRIGSNRETEFPHPFSYSDQ